MSLPEKATLFLSEKFALKYDVRSNKNLYNVECMKIIIFLSLIFLLLMCISFFRFTCCKPKENPRYTGMPDPEFVRKQKTIEKVNMVYGTDKCPITLYRPVDAYFTVAPGTALNARDRVWLRANDSSWSAEVFGVVCYEKSVQSEAFVEY